MLAFEQTVMENIIIMKLSFHYINYFLLANCLIMVPSHNCELSTYKERDLALFSLSFSVSNITLEQI